MIKLIKLIFRNLIFYHYRHLLLMMGMSIVAMVAMGSLQIGHSVQSSLQRLNQERTGDIAWSLNSPSHRFFSEDILTRFSGYSGRFAIGIQLSGHITYQAQRNSIHLKQDTMPLTKQDTKPLGTKNARVQIWGVNPNWAEFFQGATWPFALEEGKAWISASLAEQLQLQTNDECILRIPLVTNIPSEAPLSQNPQIKATKIMIAGIVPNHLGARLSPYPNQVSQHNVFVSHTWLQKQANFPTNKINVLIAAPPLVYSRPKTGDSPAPPLVHSRPKTGDLKIATFGEFQNAIQSQWQIEDMGLSFVMLDSGEYELRDDSIFIPNIVTSAVIKSSTQAKPIFSYLVNRIELSKINPNPIFIAPNNSQSVAPNNSLPNISVPLPPNNLQSATPNNLQSATPNNPQSATPQNLQSAAPYSIVTAADFLTVTPIQDNEILVNEWLARNMQVQVKDYLQLRYWVFGPLRELQEQTAYFQVAGVVPMQKPYLDSDFMPNFPGLKNIQDCLDWRPGIPIDLQSIRPEDREYWTKYQGTPKAFISFQAGQKLWTNRFGNCTAIRYSSSIADLEIRQLLQSQISLLDLGFQFQDWQATNSKAQTPTVDFGQLFLGLSFFLIISALLLLYLLLSLTIQERLGEFSILYSLGFSNRTIQWMVRIEIGLTACIGLVIGDFFARGYAFILLEWLKILWPSSATIHLVIDEFSLGIWIGRICILVVLMATCNAPIRKLQGNAIRISTHVLPYQMSIKKWRIAGILGLSIAILALGNMLYFSQQDAQTLVIIFLVTGFLWLILSICGFYWFMLKPEKKNIAIPDSARTNILVNSTSTDSVAPLVSADSAPTLVSANSAPTLVSANSAPTLVSANSAPTTSMSFAKISRVSWFYWAWLNIVRYQRRSMAVVSILACGIFVVLVIGSSQQIPLSSGPQSGTGGFDFYIETSIPIVADISNSQNQVSTSLSNQLSHPIIMLPIRSWEGDDASCQNLYQAQHPRILGVPTHSFTQLHAFQFVQCLDFVDKQKPWKSLEDNVSPNIIPAVIDHNVMLWGLGKKLGDELEYYNQAGQAIRLKIVATLDNSIFQGNILISQDIFIRHFPSATGSKIWLVKMFATNSSTDTSAPHNSFADTSAPHNSFADTSAPHNSSTDTSSNENIESWQLGFSEQWQDWGVNIENSQVRLANFLMVENAYLTLFLGLGGIGLVLGSLGLGFILLRNLAERQREWAILHAMGFSYHQTSWLILLEHALLAGIGYICGSIAVVIALLPNLIHRPHHIPWEVCLICLLLVLVSIIISLALGIRKLTSNTKIGFYKE